MIQALEGNDILEINEPLLWTQADIVHIELVEIQNFRKLKACRVEIGLAETIFVGANNSGKTSAMDALTLFLKKGRRKNLATTDFTLSNWVSIDQLGERWTTSDTDEGSLIDISDWLPLVPSVDVWLKADEKDLHHVAHLLPTLDWTPEDLLGIRFMFSPKNIEQLYKEFRSHYASARKAESAATNPESPPSLWPSTMRDFLDRRLHSQFEVQAYVLDPMQLEEPEEGVAKPQSLPFGGDQLVMDPFEGLIKIDTISAQRGFSDPKSEDESYRSAATLSAQLRSYFSQHLNPSEAPDATDIDALEAFEVAKTVFDEKLVSSFQPAIAELEGLNYPGFSDPKISIKSKIDPRDSLDHDAAVQFDLPGSDSLFLPEKYNGLGYQNLISMVFNLIRFRDEWMRVGKAIKNMAAEDTPIQPLHVVLVEEPEAHLHAQVQQVFIKKAYEVLRNYAKLEDAAFNTQLIVSTHSSHIAHELDFSCLRYFRRERAKEVGEIPTATVINLSNTFGNNDETSKFATRYLRTTHCDLFFADAALLVEGSAERMLIPHFIRSKFPKLEQSYICLLEIGGAHAHRMEPLLNTLGLLSLVVTDLDSIMDSDSGKVRPERDKGYRTGNTTLKNWVPRKELLDELLDVPDDAKQTTDRLVRVAYQCPFNVEFKDGEGESEVIPYTFEDSMALTNVGLIREYADPVGLLRRLQESLMKNSLSEAVKDMFKNLDNARKAEMALELLYRSEPDELVPPKYIADGLKWLEENLEARKVDAILTDSETVNGR